MKGRDLTTTHTHIIDQFANPYLRCDECGQPVEGFVAFEGQVPGCEHTGRLIPCGHLGVTSICPSWGPVGGCECQEHLGYVPHPPDDGHDGDGSVMTQGARLAGRVMAKTAPAEPVGQTAKPASSLNRAGERSDEGSG